MTDARDIALDALEAVLESGRPLAAVLEADTRLDALARRDRGFAYTLVATTLRRLGQVDALLADCMERPLPARAGAARAILRLGACQLVFLETPPHAAVATAVDQARRRRQDRFAGLINAVLRRLSREGSSLLAGQDAARLNTPDWLWRNWQAAYGQTTARAIAEAHLREPPLDLTVRDDAPGWAARLGAALLPTGSIRLTAAGPVESLPGYAEGSWWVQDAAAALPARLLGNVAGASVVDLCAAPGGKTAQLAAAGAGVIAVERDGARLRRLRDNLARLGLSADLVEADATAWRPPRPADAVLLDAPCTATGTIRRHPDLPWTRRPRDIDNVAATQHALLSAAAAMVRPGGILVYSVCSLEPEEGPARVAAFLAGAAPFRRDPIQPAEVGGLPDLVDPAGDLRTLPCHLGAAGGMDGFYACRLIRAG